MSDNRKLAAILSADVVGYSRLAGADEERTLARLRALRSDLIDPTISVHRGRIVKRTGDGALVEFRSVVDAVRCAMEVQSGMAERNAGLAPDRRIEFRIGVHVGDVVEESDGDLMGDSVNIAARLEGVAAPGSICLSEDAYRQVKSRLDISVNDLGDMALKNIAEPVRIFLLNVGTAELPPVAGVPVMIAETRPELSIAVLPFTNMSGDQEQDYFADGISEDIITALSKLSQLFVISRNSSFTFKGRNVNIREAAATLGVRYVLEGSVRKAGNRVRITAQLIDASSGGHLWAERFDRDMTDIFAVQDDVTHQIVAALAVNLTDKEKVQIKPDHTDNVEAYDCFLRGRELWWRSKQPSNAEAQHHFLRAVELDPGFAAAYAFLGVSHLVDAVGGWSADPAESLRHAEEAAGKAQALNGEDATAHWAQGLIALYQRRHEDAVVAFRRAIDLNPNLDLAYTSLGEALHYSGRSAEAIEPLGRALALNPYSPGLILHFQAQAYFQLGRYEQAIANLQRRLAANPDTDVSRVLMAAAYGHLGRVDDAREQWLEALRINPAYSLERRRQILPYKNPADFDRIVEGLRKARLV